MQISIYTENKKSRGLINRITQLTSLIINIIIHYQIGKFNNIFSLLYQNRKVIFKNNI